MTGTSGGSSSPRVRVIVEVLVVLVGAWMLAWAWGADRVWYEQHMTWEYCATNVDELRKATQLRWAGAAVGLIVLLVVRPLVGRWVSRRSARALLEDCARYGVALMLALVACEVFLRIRPLATPPPPIHPPHPDAVEDAVYGWGHTPKVTSTLTYGDRVVVYHMDPAGERVRNAGDVPDGKAPTILFAGESITSGIGLDYDETYPAMVGERLGIQVVNTAVHGYGSDNEYIRVRQALPFFAKPVAVVALVIPPQIERNVDDSKKVRFVLSRGELRPAGAAPAFWRESPLVDLLRRVTHYHSDEGIAVTRALLRAIRDEAKAKGAIPLFVFTHWGAPCLPDQTGVPSLERALFDGEDLPHVTVDLEGTWMEVIQHPGPEGHRRIADAVVKALTGKIATR